MSFDLIEIFHEMGLFARCVAGALVVMAVAALGVTLERLWALARAQRASRTFATVASGLLEAGEHEQLKAQALQHPKSPLAQLVGAGVGTYLAALRRPGALSPVELARRELERRLEATGQELRRGLSVLATVGSLAPFVGLLGTVVGIIDAFGGIAEKGSGGLGAVSGGISEALVVTALGLLVAIPAVLAFNFLSGRLDAATLALTQAKGEFLDHLESGHGVLHAVGAQREVGDVRAA